MNFNPKLIVGLDVGTSFTKVSYRLQDSQTTQDVFAWLDSSSPDPDCTQSSTVSSALYYPPGSTDPIWGDDIESERFKSSYDPSRLVQYWKSGLQPGSGFHMDVIAQSRLLQIEIDQFPFQMTVMLLSRLFFDRSAFFESILEEKSCNSSDFCLVFGKPSGWQKSTYLPFQRAAEHVGFARHQTKFVSETEAFLREYLKQGKKFRTGDSIVIVDCGGYTVDIDAHRIVEFGDDEKSVTRVSPAGIHPLSLPYGSQSVWPLAKKYFRSELERKNDYTEDQIRCILDDISPKWVRQVQRASNHSMSAKSENHIFYHSLIRADESRDPPWLAGKLQIPCTTVVEIIQEASIIPIVDGLRGFIQRLPTKPTCVVLGGGYSTMRLLRDTLFHLGQELDVKIFQPKDKKPVAAGAVDMAANPDVVESRLLKSSYSIVTLYPWTKAEENSKPRAEHEPYHPHGSDRTWEFRAYEWLGRMGDAIQSDQVFSADLDESHWRSRVVREQGDLSWWETINSWHGNPGPCKFTVPKELKDMTQTGSISLKVDFSKAIPGYSNLLKKKKRRGSADVCTIHYCVELHLDGETLSYVVKAKDRHETLHVLQLDGQGAIDSVILKGDCPQIHEEDIAGLWSLVSSGSSCALTNGSTISSSASSATLSAGESPRIDDGGGKREYPVTPILSLVRQLRNISIDSPDLQLLQEAKLENPFSPSYAKEAFGLNKPPRRFARKSLAKAP